MNLIKVLFNLGYLLSFTSSGDIRPYSPSNSECNSCLLRQRNGENIECPIGCEIYDIEPPCPPCPPSPPCPPPGPNCRYIRPDTDNCGCIYGCGVISCNPNIDSLPPSSYPCPIEQIDCINEFVCPKVTEITHCSKGGIKGHTTYQLSVVLQSNHNLKNIYAIFGDYSNIMYFPPAYQIDGPFNSNIGGISSSIISIFPNALYDSWITIGITDGDPGDKISTIGIDFDEWSETNSITTSNGAVFLMDPNDIISESEYILGQITVANDIIDILTVNIQGKKNNEETWKEDGVSFVLNPSNIIQDTIPEGCSLWYDGCNLCQINNGILGRCTRNMCITDDEPECRVFNSGH